MRRLLLILTLCFPGLVGFSPDYGLKSGKTSSSSGFIDITVLSNIGKQFFQYNLKQQCLSFTEEPGTEYVPGTSVSRILIPVKEFNCTNRLAYEDLQTLLKAEHYPNLEIKIPHNLSIKYDTDDSAILKGVSITVAGVSKQFDISCKIDKVDNAKQILNGTTRIKLTDLEIVPPVRLLGLVKVYNEIIIDFELCLKSNG